MKSAASATAASVMPVRRDLRFDLPVERAKDWHGKGPHVTHFFNALSLLFPAGERFFMDAVRHYRDRIDDPVLKRQVLGFIGQEASTRASTSNTTSCCRRTGCRRASSTGASGRCSTT